MNVAWSCLLKTCTRTLGYGTRPPITASIPNILFGFSFKILTLNIDTKKKKKILPLNSLLLIEDKMMT